MIPLKHSTWAFLAETTETRWIREEESPQKFIRTLMGMENELLAGWMYQAMPWWKRPRFNEKITTTFPEQENQQMTWKIYSNSE